MEIEEAVHNYKKVDEFEGVVVIIDHERAFIYLGFIWDKYWYYLQFNVARWMHR